MSWFYIWTASPDSALFQKIGNSDEYYNLQVDGFRAGKLSLNKEVPAGLLVLKDPYDPAQNSPYRRHDASYYKGAYYIYFGVTPAVTLFWPYLALTGKYLSHNQACVIFCIVGFGCALWLLALIRWRYFPHVGTGAVVTCGIAVGLCSMVPALLRRPDLWEVPIASAYAYFMFATLCVFYALYGRRRVLWLILASLSYGLAVGGRPTYAFGAAMLLVPVWCAWRNLATPRKLHDTRFLKFALAAILPLAIVVGGLMVYNYLRFENPFEFGQNYQMSGTNEAKLAHFSLNYFWFNMRVYLLEPARLSVYFPFIKVIDPPSGPLGQFGIEDPYGILPNIPIVLFAIFVFWVRKQKADLLPFSVAMLLGLLLVGATVFLFGGACNRYMVDFLPVLILMSSVGFFASTLLFKGWWRVITNLLWVLAWSWSLLFNIFVSFSHNDLLRASYPRTYRPLAHFFNFPSLWLAQWKDAQFGPLELTLKFPKDQPGKLQPLFVSGVAFMSDYVYAYYSSNKTIVLGFEHTGHGGPVSQPVVVDYDKPHTVKIEMGSLYPPLDHPYFDRFGRARAVEDTRRLRITLDGVPYIDTLADCYDAVSFMPLVGTSSKDRKAFGPSYTGEIISTRHTKPEPSLALSRSIGPLKIALNLPKDRMKRNEPLICTGEMGRGDLLYLTYLDQNHVTLTLDHWGVGGPTSEPIEVNYDQIQVFEISMGSLFPEKEKPAKIASEKWQFFRNHLLVRLNGESVLRSTSLFHDAPLETITVGVNEIHASRCDANFSGRLLSVGPADADELGISTKSP
ncbi:MAG TPA: hypothetical protein VKC60_10830 [Opitutaceae bacterium]|nr:hypothetical protein [Opitutaceae bacterium]